MADIHDPARRRVDLLHLQILVEHDDAVGSVVDDGVGEALSLLSQEGQAHVDVCLTLIHGDCFLAAGIVATGTAVELLLRSKLASLVENLLDLSPRASDDAGQ